jgi:hypothetical protein
LPSFISVIAVSDKDSNAVIIPAIFISSISRGKAKAIGKPSLEMIAAAFTSGIAANNFLRRSFTSSTVLNFPPSCIKVYISNLILA